MRDLSLDADRRKILKMASLSGISLLAFNGLKDAEAMAASHSKTPTQPEGPFYPVADQLDKDADMTRVDGLDAIASGQTVNLEGAVLDANNGAPVVGAVLEFW